MKNVPKKLEDKATIAQVKQLKEIRDCPDPRCSGLLERVSVWEHDGAVLEKYVHKSSDADHDGCDCDQSEDSRGLLRRIMSTDPIAVHHRDGKSEGRGCLRGEL